VGLPRKQRKIWVSTLGVKGTTCKYSAKVGATKRDWKKQSAKDWPNVAMGEKGFPKVNRADCPLKEVQVANSQLSVPEPDTGSRNTQTCQMGSEKKKSDFSSGESTSGSALVMKKGSEPKLMA